MPRKDLEFWRIFLELFLFINNSLVCSDLTTSEKWFPMCIPGESWLLRIFITGESTVYMVMKWWIQQGVNQISLNNKLTRVKNPGTQDCLIHSLQVSQFLPIYLRIFVLCVPCHSPICQPAHFAVLLHVTIFQGTNRVGWRGAGFEPEPTVLHSDQVG
jgi:hypothetical protein